MKIDMKRSNPADKAKANMLSRIIRAETTHATFLKLSHALGKTNHNLDTIRLRMNKV